MEIFSSSSKMAPSTLQSFRASKTSFVRGKKKEEEIDWKAVEKEEQYQIQQQLRQARKTGSYIKDANDRRRKVAETIAERKALRDNEKDALAKGIIPESLKDWNNYKTKSDAKGTEGVVIPLLPFGINKYDEGERFDLRSPYADMGWVDPDEVDMWAGLKKIGSKILNFSGNNDEYRKQYGKPILWAKDYEKYKEEKAQGKKEQGKGKK